MTEPRFYGFEQEEIEVLRHVVAEAKRQNEEAFDQIETDKSIDDIEDFTTATQDQRRLIDVLKRLEVKLNDG